MSVVAGNRPLSESALVPSASEFSHFVKATAASLCVLVTGTTLADPPFSEDTGSPVLHCGIGAARHWPEVCGMVLARLPGAQAPTIHIAYLPLLIDCHHSFVQPGVGSTSFFSSRPVQNSETFLAPSSARFTPTEVADFCWNGRLPACQSRLSRPPASPGSMEVMKRFGSAWWILAAAASNSAQVLGGAMPNSPRTFSL